MTYWKDVPDSHAGRWEPPHWLLRYSSALGGVIRRELHDLGNAPWSALHHTIDYRAFAKLYGALDGPGHSFGHAPLLPFSMYEPQLTQALCNFMADAATDTDQRCIAETFITALLQSARKQIKTKTDEAPERFDGREEIRPESIKVIAEHPVTKGNRVTGYIDLWFHYETDQGARSILVENKIDHYLSEGQLRKYSEYAQRAFGQEVLKIVVTRRMGENDRKHAKEHKSWVFLTWRMVLRALERELNGRQGGLVMGDFHRFRRTMWRDFYHEV